MSYQRPHSSQLSPMSPGPEYSERDHLNMRGYPPGIRYHQRRHSPYPQQSYLGMYQPRRSQENRERYRSHEDLYYRDESPVRSPMYRFPGSRSLSMNERVGRFEDYRFRVPRGGRRSPFPSPTWDPPLRDRSPLPRDPPRPEYTPALPPLSWDPRDPDYHPAWPAPEPRSPSPRRSLGRRPMSPLSHHSYEEFPDRTPLMTPTQLEPCPSVLEQQDIDDDRTPTVNSPPSVENESTLPTEPPPTDEDIELLLHHPPLFPLHDPTDESMRDDLVRQTCHVSDPQNCYRLYTVVEDCSCPDIPKLDVPPRLLGTYLVPELGMCDADLWIRRRHRLHGMESGDVGDGYDYDKTYEDKYGGRVCALYTREEDVKKIGLRYKVWTKEERVR